MNTGYFKSMVMGNVFKSKTSPGLPTAFYLGLLHEKPSDTIIKDGKWTNDNQNEPSDGGYVRQDITHKLGTPVISTATPFDVTVSNNEEITFPESSTDWFSSGRKAMYYGIFDAESGGNLLMYNKLTKDRTIEAQTVAIIKPNSLRLQLLDNSVADS